MGRRNCETEQKLMQKMRKDGKKGENEDKKKREKEKVRTERMICKTGKKRRKPRSGGESREEGE